MKQLLFLLLFPCLAMAQYQGNGNQKITLGEQTSADGLVFRGVENDTALITPFSDTSAYIILDTINNKFYNYNRSTNVWSLAGGGGGGGGTGTVTSITAGTGLTGGTITTSGTLAADINFLVTRFDTASMLLPYWRSGRFSGVLPIANGGTGQTTLAAAGINTGSGNQNYLPKYTATGTTLGNSLIYDNGSGITIGTTTPLGGLLLQLTGPNSRIAMLNNSPGSSTENYSQMFFGYGSGGVGEYAEFYRQNNNKRFHVYNDAGDIGLSTRYSGGYIYDIYLNTSGNVGIGTTSPSDKFHVVGNARITGAYDVTTASAANVFVTTTGVLQRSTSSIKYKTDVEDYSKGLKEVMQLRPVTFKSINSNNDKTYAGFIAEELADLKLNELVENNDNDEPDAISYAYMVTLLTKAIQEQQEQISQLKKRLLILENK